MATKPEQLTDAAREHLRRIGLSETKGGALAVFKQYDVVVEAPEDDRCVRFIVTTRTPDRENDLVETGGIMTGPYEANPVVMWAHDYKMLPVGRCVKIERYTDQMICTVEFASADLNPFADQVYRMVRAGFLRACSIGFRPTEWEYNEQRGGVDFVKSEMLEFSICPIPANGEALVAARAAGIDAGVIKDWADRTSAALAEGQAPPVSKTLLDLLNGARSIAKVATPFEAPAVEADPVRWNRSLGKAFDIDRQEFRAASVEQETVAKYCGCEIKALHYTRVRVMGARMGAYLLALDEQLRSVLIDDIRNLSGAGYEAPPEYETIQLNSTRSAEFLIDGLRFVNHHETKMAIRVEPTWWGLSVTAYAERSNAEMIGEFLREVETRAASLKLLKGEAFSLSGEFLTRSGETAADLFLTDKNASAIRRTVELLNEQGADLENRGLLLVGPPGTGKTLAGRVLMNEAAATFIWVSARDFYYGGGGFAGMADAFSLAREYAPAVLFVEDIDNWMDGTMVDLLKTEMDGVKQSRGVVTVLTTNYPETLPKALIDRPGRFHDVLRFDVPDAEARAQMIGRWLPDLTGDDLTEIVKALHGYSGAHVREFARFATILREQDGLTIGDAARAALAKVQEQRDLISAVQSQGSRYRAAGHVVARALAPVVPHDVDLTVQKRGRVLSRTNEALLRSAEQGAQACREAIRQVLASVENPDPEEPGEGDEPMEPNEDDMVRRAIAKVADLTEIGEDDEILVVDAEPVAETPTEPEGDLLVVLDDEPETIEARSLATADDVRAVFSGHEMKAAIEEALTEIVGTALSAAINEARGRI